VTSPKKKPSEKKAAAKRKASESSECEEEEEKPKKRAKKLAEVEEEPIPADKPQKPACKGKAHDQVAKEDSKIFRWFPSWSKKQLTESKQQEEED